MLKSFFGISFASGEAEKPSPETSHQGKIDPDSLKLLVDFFPIGKKLHYYPEYKKEIILDTIVVAYCVNGEFIYSGEGIERDSQGFPKAFHAAEGRSNTPVSKIKQFQLLVPDTSSLELKLDYPRRALIGRGRQFMKGNDISLVSVAGAKGVATLHNEVAKKVVLQEGPYAQTDMILLTPIWDSLSVTDQRGKARTKINVPAAVYMLNEQISALCTIIDISENAVRIRFHGRDAASTALRKGDEVILDINLGESERRYTIKGSVLASRSQDISVIQLEGLFKDGKLGSLEPLDRLELKAGLLSYVH